MYKKYSDENYIFQAGLIMLYYFFWVIPRRLNIIWQRFGTLCQFHLHRYCKQASCLWSLKWQTVPKSRHAIQTPGNRPKERIQHSEHGESFKSMSSYVSAEC